MQIKAGDLSGYVAADRQRYGSDMYFAGGEGKGIDPPDTPTEKQTEVAASDARLYGSFREGQFSYRVPVPDGKYVIVLHFVEPTAAAVGERVFDVSVSGKRVLKHVDVFALAGGKLKGVERTVQAKTKEGVLLIEFQPVKGQALVSALSITPTG